MRGCRPLCLWSAMRTIENNENNERIFIMAGRKKVNDGISYPTGKVLMIVSHLFDKQGNVLLTSEKILSALSLHRSQIKSYGFINHDKDTFDAEQIAERAARHTMAAVAEYKRLAIKNGLAVDTHEESGYIKDENLLIQAEEYAENLLPEKHIGDVKDPHFHVVIVLTKERRIDEIARWFGIEPNFIKIYRGKTAERDAYLYLIHHNQKNKYQYAPEEVTASFDYVNDLKEYLEKEERHERYNTEKDDIRDLIEDVYSKGLPLRTVIKKLTYPIYQEHENDFIKAHAQYLYDNFAMPPCRKTFYISANKGQGGEGKTQCTHAIARQLAKQFSQSKEDLMTIMEGSFMNNALSAWIYEINDISVAWQDYNGQPIVIFNDVKAGDLLSCMKSRRMVKELLDEFPTKKMLHVKFGETCCTAEYILINGIQDFDDFKHDLATKKGSKDDDTEEKALTQFDRRFLGHIRLLDDNVVSVLINEGWFDTGSNIDYRRMTELLRMKMNFRRLMTRTKGKALDTVEQHAFLPLVIKCDDLNKRFSEKISDDRDEAFDITEFCEILPTESEVLAPKIADVDAQKQDFIDKIQAIQEDIHKLEKHEKICYSYCLDNPTIELSLYELKELYNKDSLLLKHIRDRIDGIETIEDVLPIV